MMREKVLDPLGMTNSTLRAAARRRHVGAHQPRPRWPGQGAWEPSGTSIRSRPRPGLWTTPSDLARFAIEVQVATGRGQRQGAVAGVSSGNGRADRRGSFRRGFLDRQAGEGWYFSHSGGNWGFLCDLLAHVRKGYGVVVMTNGSNFQIITEIEARVAAAYGWDTLDKPIPR